MMALALPCGLTFGIRAAPLRVKYPSANFASAAYWDSVYEDTGGSSNAGHTEWLLGYEGGLAALLHSSLADTRTCPVLELGCGSSSLSAQMHIDGWVNITGCDISTNAVLRAQRTTQPSPGLTYVVADARQLSRDLGRNAFAAIVDKATLDAIACSDGWDYEVGLVAAELVRVLRPGGKWLCISLTPPAVLLPILSRADWASLTCEPWNGWNLYRGRTHAQDNEGHWALKPKC
mmetsp:Transcript_16487/g.35724  ORF Transcript_16487/g.35724 Transcript_16487/m.35724 type:complete len:233 (+) Transcript_16487:134-832(+)